ncbi:uncharacterized protein UTRI_02469 [Ustilago trichophora]|uniref:Uncharacterized protein n=1 Tax=Ustilago trichophora TaxID=86804 RepID=A0A5C3E668_9BASI|nr:uncharacterized protein UTRI_02469 [Ustilago trichophora]
MTVIDAAVVPSPLLSIPSKTASTSSTKTSTTSGKSFIRLSPDQVSALSIQIYRHTPAAPISEDVLKIFGEGMDGGPGIHTVPNPEYETTTSEDLPTFWLGALGSIAPGTGSILINHIKQHLATTVCSGQPFKIRAYTVAEWGVNQGFRIPQNAPLPTWFNKQGFQV